MALGGHVRMSGMGRPIALDLPAALALIPNSDGDPAALRELLMSAAAGVGTAMMKDSDNG